MYVDLARAFHRTELTAEDVGGSIATLRNVVGPLPLLPPGQSVAICGFMVSSAASAIAIAAGWVISLGPGAATQLGLVGGRSRRRLVLASFSWTSLARPVRTVLDLDGRHVRPC